MPRDTVGRLVGSLAHPLNHLLFGKEYDLAEPALRILALTLGFAFVNNAFIGALTVLDRWGTMSFETVAGRAIEYAEQGFPLRPRTVAAIGRNAKFIQDWPENRSYWFKPDGAMYQPGETIRFPTLARTLNRMVEAERGHRTEGRSAGIVAARDRFYKGDIAEEMVAFIKQKEAPFELAERAEPGAGGSSSP